jgi:uncharacterized protein
MPPDSLVPAGSRRARRIEGMDALRGLALLGILQVNIQSFTWGAGEPLGYLAVPPQAGESLLYFLQATLIEGKFYPIFAFLFGVGMALQMRKLRRLHPHDVPAAQAAYRRRLLILFALGLAHGLLFYSGDVLSTYAACGLLFAALAPPRLAALRRFTAALWAAAALSLLLPMAIVAFLGSNETPEQIPASVTAAHAVYVSAGFAGQLPQRALDEIWQQVGDIPTFWPQVLALFGLGVIAGRLGWVQAPERHPQVWRRAWRLGLGLGLPLSAAGAALSVARARALPGAEGGWESVLLGLGSVLAAAYVAAALHAFQRPWGRVLRGWLAAPGRLSLSNYVGQSVVMAALLSGWGLGLGAQAGRAQLALLGCAIFAAQMLASRALLLRFGQGPLEALWRRATYGPRPAR